MTQKSKSVLIIKKLLLLFFPRYKFIIWEISFLSVICTIFIKLLFNKPEIVFISKEENVKYILDWTFRGKYQFVPYYGSQIFSDRNCSTRNCYITSNRSFFRDVTKFDAVSFNAVYFLSTDYFPPKRSPGQKYIFATPESTANYPLCVHHFKAFFNWTWTYRLDSDIVFPYLSIRDRNGKLIGPKKEMHWKNVEEMQKSTLKESVKEKLLTKTRAAAWFVSNCITLSKRQQLVEKLRRELQKYNVTVDIYGACGELDCPEAMNEYCLDILQKHYYFYLAFENSLCEDYVTEKLLNALNHFTIPVVYSGANLTRFLPEGIYLDARKLDASELARQMNELMQDREKYYQFFKWHNFYSYNHPWEFPDSDTFCRLCEMLNNETVMKQKQVYYDFTKWWRAAMTQESESGVC